MKQLITMAVIAALLIACGNNSESKSSATESTPANNEATTASADGEKAYKQYCVTCHGLYGDMGASGAFNLTTSTLSLDERINVITNGREGTNMVGFKSILSEDQIKAVAQYVETLRQ